MSVFRGESKLFPRQSAAVNAPLVDSRYPGQRSGDIPDWRSGIELDISEEVYFGGTYYRVGEHHVSDVSIATDIGAGRLIAFAGTGVGTTFTTATDVISVASNGQTAFTTSTAYVASGFIALFVNGIQYNIGTSFTLVGTVLTWLDVPIVLVGPAPGPADVITVIYEV